VTPAVTAQPPAPMMAGDLKDWIDWSAERPLAGIPARYLDPARRVAERKIDGNRAQAIIEAALAGTVLDGEFLAPVKPGYDRALLNHSTGLFNSAPPAARDWFRIGPPRFVVFDVPAFCGIDSTGLPYRDRRLLLELVVGPHDPGRDLPAQVRLLWETLTGPGEGEIAPPTILDRFPGCGIELVDQMPATAAAIEQVFADGGEGVVLKEWDGRYHPGQRCDTWLKVKRYASIDCFLTGRYKPGKNGWARRVGAVEVAVMDDAGRVVPVGYVAVKPAWAGEVTAADGTLNPAMIGTVIEVEAQGVNEYGRLRHPHMMRVRPDKAPAGCSSAQLSRMPRV
jgi:ATP-dependent DNA ligase